MRAMILAAGRGERMRPLTDITPKPLVEVGGKQLIEYHLQKLAANGVSDVVINLAYMAAAIRAALGDGSRYDLCIHYIDEGSEALDTGGGVCNALPLLGEDTFLVINADVWTDYPMMPVPLTGGDVARLVLVDNPSHHPGGDFHLRNDRLENTGEPRLTFSGIGYYRAEFFAGCSPGRFSIVPLIRAAADRGMVAAEHYKGEWFDIGTPERLDALCRSVSS